MSRPTLSSMVADCAPRDHEHVVLEFPALLEAIAGRTRSARGRERVLALQPARSIDAARTAQTLYADLLACHRLGDAPPPAPPPDAAAILERLDHEGAVLSGEELARVHRLLDQVDALLAWHRRARRETTGIDRLVARLDPLASLARELGRSLDPSGVLRDDASPELARIRRAIRGLRERLAARLEGIVRDLSAAESFVTLREGRYVVALPASQRRDLPGMVLGHSGSGASVFVEPREAAEMNSDLAERLVEEAREQSRILRDLSGWAHRERDALHRNFETLAELDQAEAVAAWARAADATLPELSLEQVLTLRGARHPLLEERHRRGEMGAPVPLDLRLGGPTRMLLVSGPNMGGKTVAMKTVGLLGLLAITGLPVTAAAGTRVPWLDRVICDIGDEQSLLDDVSTFLSHLRRVSEAVDRATDRSLVLLDELGSGTDPTEGAALGQAVLEALLSRGALCIATTHHGSLKAFAQETEGVQNASMAFDESTLSPLFRMELGVPGGSRALQVAERFGMDGSVLGRAQALLPRGERDLSELLVELGRLREQVEAERNELARTKEALEARGEELRDALAHLEGERKERKQAELAARRELLRTLESQIEEYRKRLRRERKASPSTLTDARGLARRISESIDAEAQTEAGPSPDGEPLARVGPGERVLVSTLGVEGTVVTTPDADGRVRVQIGAATAILPLATLRRPVRTDAAKARDERVLGPRLPEIAITTEIDVRGYETPDAIEAVERFLENAAMGGLTTARIIHGKGKGILREEMRRWLKRSELVKEFRLGEIQEGGTGVTVVTLA